jgi:hypothetical protein
MTIKKPTKLVVTQLSASSIQKLAEETQANREYLISWDEEGEIIKCVLMGSAKAPTQKQKSAMVYGSPEEREYLTECTLDNTKVGCMVTAYKRLPNSEIVASSSNPEGFIIYDKKAIRLFNNLEEAISELLKYKDHETYDFVLRYKRRQQKWLLYSGIYTKELPKGFKVKDNPLKAYDLSKRSHLWEPAQGAE